MRDTDDPNSSNINTFMTQLLKIEHTKVMCNYENFQNITWSCKYYVTKCTSMHMIFYTFYTLMAQTPPRFLFL